MTENHLQRCQFGLGPQLPYTPDISSYDFFLFDDLKPKLKGEEFQTTEELQESLKEPLGQLSPKTMPRVYEHRIKRLN
jgi:hypothetical protein